MSNSTIITNSNIPQLEEIYQYYELCYSTISERRSIIIDNAFQGICLYDEYKFMSVEEIADYFEDSLDEIELVFILHLVAIAEGIIRADYYKRVRDKMKDPISKKFRILQKDTEKKSKLDKPIIPIEDIIDVLQESGINSNELKPLFKYRNWLAHGRYWVFKGKNSYDIRITYNMLFGIIKHTS